jgi:hypothetical protein
MELASKRVGSQHVALQPETEIIEEVLNELHVNNTSSTALCYTLDQNHKGGF